MKRSLDLISGVAAIQILFQFALGAVGILGSSSASAQSIALTKVRILDGNGATPVEHGTIVIQGRKIKVVGPTSNVAIPPAARTIDEGGRTGLPGLADIPDERPEISGRGEWI